MRKILKSIYRLFIPESIPPCDADTINVLSYFLHPNSNAIDIGCNRGSILLEITRLAPNGQHYAFEPIPALYKRLSARFPMVKCHRIALSDKRGSVSFNYFTQMDGFSGIVRRDIGVNPGLVEEISVDTECLDAIIPTELNITLIKIDVEGAEYEVMSGAKDLLQRCRPVIVFECGKGGLDIYGHLPEQIFELLTDCNLVLAKLLRWSPLAEILSRETFIEEFWRGEEYMFVAFPQKV